MSRKRHLKPQVVYSGGRVVFGSEPDVSGDSKDRVASAAVEISELVGRWRARLSSEEWRQAWEVVMATMRQDDVDDIREEVKRFKAQDHASYVAKLVVLLDSSELTEAERDAFASMLGASTSRDLSPKQRDWIDRCVERYGVRVGEPREVPRGREVPTAPVLENLPKKPPRKLGPGVITSRFGGSTCARCGGQHDQGDGEGCPGDDPNADDVADMRWDQ